MIEHTNSKLFDSKEEFEKWSNWLHSENNHQIKKEFGDYQTPVRLIDKILILLEQKKTNFSHILEPTCGEGNFITSILKRNYIIKTFYAIEIQKEYYYRLKHCLIKSHLHDLEQLEDFTIVNKNFFNCNIEEYILNDSLVIGNLPWITSAELGILKSENLPTKSNFQKRNGLDSITGKANFDIAEHILIMLLNSLISIEYATISVLVKNSVAINIMKQIPEFKWNISEFSMYNIDSKKEFNVSVEACLLYIKWDKYCTPISQGTEYSLYNPTKEIRRFGYINENFVSNLSQYGKGKMLENNGTSQKLIWRSGIKHDSAKIMELDFNGETYISKDNTIFSLDTAFIHPLIKSSDIKSIDADFIPRKGVIVTQKFVGDDTSLIESQVPELWKYLNSHLEKLNARKSVIYKNKPQFCIFGIGDYSFSQYKIVISGMYKIPRFSLIGSYNDKVIMLDDTTYSLSFNEIKDALIVFSTLNSPLVQDFLVSIAFIGNKRPYTKEILERINILEAVRKMDLHFMNDFISQNGYQIIINADDICSFINKYRSE